MVFKALDLGCGRGYLSTKIEPDCIQELIQCEMSEKLLRRALPSNIANTTCVDMDEETIIFPDSHFDLVISSGSMHWVNNLPGLMTRVMNCLCPDGVFLGSLLGGETLFELRSSLQLAEQELENGFGPHISPMINMPDMGRLLHHGGFCLITVDQDEIVVHYPNMKELMNDLTHMGEGNCAWNSKPALHRSTIELAGQKYIDMYGDSNGIPATFQTINFIAWKPHESQPKAKPRGSAQRSFKDEFKKS